MPLKRFVVEKTIFVEVDSSSFRDEALKYSTEAMVARCLKDEGNGTLAMYLLPAFDTTSDVVVWK